MVLNPSVVDDTVVQCQLRPKVVLESCTCNSRFPKPCSDVFLRCIAYATRLPRLGLNQVKWFTTCSSWCIWNGIDAQNLDLGGVDGQT